MVRVAVAVAVAVVFVVVVDSLGTRNFQSVAFEKFTSRGRRRQRRAKRRAA